MSRVSLRLVASAVVLLVTSVAGQEPGSQPTFRAAVDFTAVEVTVRAPAGHLLTELERDDFRVERRGATLPIQQFAVDRQPVTAVVMIETAGDLPRHRELAAALVEAIASGDRLAIGSYGFEVAVSPLLTDNKAVLRRVMDEELWYGTWSPVSEAAVRASASLPSTAARPTVLFIGIDPSRDTCAPLRPAGCIGLDAAKRSLRQRDVLVYGIQTGLGHEWGAGRSPVDTPRVLAQSRVADGPMRALSSDFGGYVDLDGKLLAQPDVPAGAILDQLRVRYVIGFDPGMDAGLDDVRIRVLRSGATVQIRKTSRRQ